MFDRNPDRSSSIGSVLFFLVGGLTGAAVALLLAPRSGREMRDLTRQTLDETAGAARDFKDRLVSRGRKVQEQVGDRIDQAVATVTGDEATKRPA